MEDLDYIGKVNSKHGVFTYCHYDQYIGTALREYGEFCEIELSLMQKFINLDDFVFDIGANIGCFSIPFSKKVGPKGRVLSFEPQKFICKLLRKNAKDNHLKNIKIFNQAVGRKNTFTELNKFDYSRLGNFGGIGLKEDYDNSKCAHIIEGKKEKVQVINLDKFLEIEKCNFIKMDVELMEMEVLKGGKKFLSKFRPILWIENHYDPKKPNTINQYLLENDYVPYWTVANLFNADNYFVNDENHYKKIATINTLAIPLEKKMFYKLDPLDEITSPFTKPVLCLRAPIK